MLLGAGLAAVFALALSAICTTAKTRTLAGSEVAPAGTSSQLDQPGLLTFNKDIASIIFQHCTPCHRPGEVAPFPLVTYQDVRKRATLIAAVVEKRVMPPWKPEPGYGDFRDARRLSDDQVAIIQRWVEHGMAEGRGDDLPQLPQFPVGWPLGAPDFVATMPQPFQVPAEGPDVYRCFVLPTRLPEDKYLVAFDLRPSNRKVVHHALVMSAPGGSGRKLESTPGAGYPCFGAFGVLPSGNVGMWAPGSVPAPEPEGVAKLLKKGSDLVLQIHFHPIGKPEIEQSSVGLYFAKTPVQRTPVDVTLGSISLDLPPGKKNYKATAFYIFPIDVETIGIFPHAHYLCREIKATATLPDGTSRSLLWIKDWDFDWQQRYRYVVPLKLPQGTRVDAEWTYDNSADNPRNPNHPPQRVFYGEQSTDEMAELKLEVVAANQADVWRLMHGPLQRVSQGSGLHPDFEEWTLISKPLASDTWKRKGEP